MFFTIPKFVVVLTAFAAFGSASPLAQRSVVTGSSSDPNIKYIGRWDSANVNGFWSAPYLRVRFTNTTTLKLKLDHSTTFRAGEVTVAWRITSGSTVFGPTALTLNGSYTGNSYDITPSGGFLAHNVYSLQLGGLGWHDVLQFRGLEFGNGGYTVSQNFPTKLIEFVGDSITAGATDTLETWSDYSFLTGEKLAVEHTQIAYPGICLTNWDTCSNPGMVEYYLSAQQPEYPLSNWTFNKYTANAAVIMLGQNDRGNGNAPTNYFQANYTNLLTSIRSKYPSAHIFCLQTFRGYYAAQIVASIAERNVLGDKALTFVNTSGWLNTSDFLTGAGPHPSDAGHVKVANLLTPIIKKVLGW